AVGIEAIIAKSFARIFFRNGINVGLILIEADTEKISQNDILKVDITSGKIVNKTTNEVIPINPLPDFLLQIIQEGGIINYLKKYRDFKIRKNIKLL
ncbi:MAG TPA: 3-isopropylmalate dehydratase, partial [bacterium]|nr:3-isopropylmalate dehydratase [bacterium]